MLEHNTRLTHISLTKHPIELSTIDCIASKCKSLVYLHIKGECCAAMVLTRDTLFEMC